MEFYSNSSLASQIINTKTVVNFQVKNCRINYKDSPRGVKNRLKAVIVLRSSQEVASKIKQAQVPITIYDRCLPRYFLYNSIVHIYVAQIITGTYL